MLGVFPGLDSPSPRKESHVACSFGGSGFPRLQAARSRQTIACFFFEGINQLTKVNDMSFPFTSQSSFERCRRHPAEAVILLVQGECGGFSGEGFEERYSSLGQF